MNTKVLFVGLFLLPIFLMGQNKYLNSYPNFGVEIEKETFSYTKYPNNITIFGECSSYLDCKNLYPEQTLMSVLSADNYDWDKLNYNYPIKNNPIKYKAVKDNANRKVNFILLLKLTFNFNGLDYAIIKYHINDNDNLIPSCSILIKNTGKWFVIEPKGSLTKAYFMFNYLSLDSLDAILKNKSIGLEAFDRQLREIYSTGTLDFMKAINSTSNSKMTDEELKLILDPLINQ